MTPLSTKLNYYNIHNIITISSNEQNYIPSYFSSTNQKDIDIKISIVKNIRKYINIRDYYSISPSIFCSRRDNSVISVVNILGVQGILYLKEYENKTEIMIDSNYRLFSKTILINPISTVFPDSAIVQMIQHIRLLLKNMTFLVGGCVHFREKDKTLFVSSMGGMGKTSLVLNMMKRKDTLYLSDDMAIINEKGNVFSYPKKIRMRGMNIPPFSIEKYIDPAEKYKTKIMDVKKINSLCFLEKGQEDLIIPINDTNSFQKMMAINRKLLPYYMERTLIAHSYMNDGIDIYNLMRREEKIIHKFMEHTPCYILRCKDNDPSYYKPILSKFIENYF